MINIPAKHQQVSIVIVSMLACPCTASDSGCIVVSTLHLVKKCCLSVWIRRNGSEHTFVMICI